MFICSRIKKGEGQREEKMSHQNYERLRYFLFFLLFSTFRLRLLLSDLQDVRGVCVIWRTVIEVLFAGRGRAHWNRRYPWVFLHNAVHNAVLSVLSKAPAFPRPLLPLLQIVWSRANTPLSGPSWSASSSDVGAKTILGDDMNNESPARLSQVCEHVLLGMRSSRRRAMADRSRPG